MPACTACARVVRPVLPVAPKIAIFLTVMPRGPGFAKAETQEARGNPMAAGRCSRASLDRGIGRSGSEAPPAPRPLPAPFQAKGTRSSTEKSEWVGLPSAFSPYRPALLRVSDCHLHVERLLVLRRARVGGARALVIQRPASALQPLGAGRGGKPRPPLSSSSRQLLWVALYSHYHPGAPPTARECEGERGGCVGVTPCSCVSRYLCDPRDSTYPQGSA